MTDIPEAEAWPTEEDAPETIQPETIQRRKAKNRQLLCKLTAEEIKEKSKELTGHMMQVESLKRQRKYIGDEIKTLDQAVMDLRNTVHFQHETRPVECEAILDYSEKMVTFIRLDTGEDVETRPMTQDERQMELGLEEPEATDDEPEEEKPANPFGEAEPTPDEDGSDEEPEDEPVRTNEDGKPMCLDCDGTGVMDNHSCSWCHGSGRSDTIDCPDCNGTGLAEDNETDCDACEGNGWTEDE